MNKGIKLQLIMSLVFISLSINVYAVVTLQDSGLSINNTKNATMQAGDTIRIQANLTATGTGNTDGMVGILDDSSGIGSSSCTTGNADFECVSDLYSASGITITDNGNCSASFTNSWSSGDILQANFTIRACAGLESLPSFNTITSFSATAANSFDLSVNITINIDSIMPRINSSVNNTAPKILEVINVSANVSDETSLRFCQFIDNQSLANGAKTYINKTVSGTGDKCSQNYTIRLPRANVINFTVIVNDTSNNLNRSENIITVANTPAPQATIVFPTSDLYTNKQPLDLNVTFAEFDGDVINISYYINGVLNQTSLANTTLNASEGLYNLNVSLFDNITGASPSANASINFTIDTTKPNTTAITPLNNHNSSLQNVTFRFNFTDNLEKQANCSIYLDAALNQTNTTTLNGTSTSFIITGISEGFHNWNITCIDLALNSNTSETRNFTVDLIPPAVNRISFSPNSTDDVDPSVLLNFTVNVTDNTSVTNNVSGVKGVVLQYKQSGAGSFTNSTASFNDATGLYYANFTPNIADTWNYRIYAEDYTGNNDTSETQNISVQYDTTWTRAPGKFNNLACGFSNTCIAGNLTINNTGDFILNFDLSSNFGSTTFNDTEQFDLAAKEVKAIKVSLTAGTTASESNVVITTNAVTSNAEPDQDTTNLTFIASAGGPVFDLVILYSPVEVNRSAGLGFYLNASLKNIGNETANYTWINWTLPDNWINISGNLSINFSNISVQETVFHNITANLTSSAATGTKRVNISAASNNGVSDNASAFVVVTETSAATTITTTTTTSGGSGGGGGGSSGGGSIVQVPVKPELIEISKTVELISGKENKFTIDVTNTFEGSVLQDLTLQVDGFLSQYLAIEPKTITSLGYGQTRSFTVTVSAPAYKGYEEHTLKATVTGMLVKTEYIGNITAISKNTFTLKNYISLIIQEISKETADLSLAGAEKSILEMQDSGFPVKKSLKILQDAKEKLESGKYKLAEEASSQIKTIRDNAFSAKALIYEIKQKIYAAENKGLQAEETRKLLNLALAAFEREDFLTAIQRAKDAQLSIVIETEGKINILQFIMDYWWPILTALIAILISSYFVRKKLGLVIISRRLQDLQKEEATINELIQETQEKYYKEKKISTAEYHKSMYGYERRLSEVSQTISRLRSKRGSIIKISNEIKNLKKEDQNVIGLIKQLQEGYFNKQTVTKKSYLKRAGEYKLRRIEIERSIAVLEAKLAKKERLEELGAKEASQKKVTEEARKKEDGFEGYPKTVKPKDTSWPKIFRGFSLKNWVKGKENARSEEIKGIVDSLIKRKDTPKLVILPSERISAIQRKILGLRFGIKRERPEALAIKDALLANISVQNPKEMGSRLPKIGRTGKKQEIISKLRDKIQLSIEKPQIFRKPKRGYITHFSKEGDALRSYGFKIKIPGEKTPEPKYVLPKPDTHNKRSILNHFNEAYKHG